MPLKPEEQDKANTKAQDQKPGHPESNVPPASTSDGTALVYTLLNEGHQVEVTVGHIAPMPGQINSVLIPGLHHMPKAAPALPTEAGLFYNQAAVFPFVDARVPLSDEFRDLLDEIAEKVKMKKETVLKQGLVFVSLAQKAKQAGFKLAIVDDDGTVIANIDGF